LKGAEQFSLHCYRLFVFALSVCLVLALVTCFRKSNERSTISCFFLTLENLGSIGPAGDNVAQVYLESEGTFPCGMGRSLLPMTTRVLNREWSSESVRHTDFEARTRNHVLTLERLL
jgi:hypothetical protein